MQSRPLRSTLLLVAVIVPSFSSLMPLRVLETCYADIAKTMKVKRFTTGLLTSDSRNYSTPPFCGKRWRIIYRNAEEHQLYRVESRRIIAAREILIEASNPATAQKAITLVHAATVLLWPAALMANQFWSVEELKIKTRNSRNAPFFQASSEELPKACMIAAKASLRRKYAYALHKFLLSTQLFCMDVQSLDPSIPNFELSIFHDDHVRFAYAIVLAYSVIEELGIEMRASSAKPSKLSDGTWNPEVKTCLEGRLHQCGIRYDKVFNWMKRGTPTRIERKLPARSMAKQPWARGRVRDVTLPLIDAIASASWLRSKI